MGIHYRAALPSADVVSSLPSPLRTAFGHAALDYKQRDRGMVRAKNNQAVDSRAKNFANWMARMRLHDNTVFKLKQDQDLPLLVAYLFNVAYNKGGLKIRKY
jgi:hypothetical protein